MKPNTSTDSRLPTALCTDIRTGRRPNAITVAERKSPPRTLTALLAPLFLAGALLGVSSNAAAQLAVNLGADQTVEPGAQITINAEVTGAVAPEASLGTSVVISNRYPVFPSCGRRGEWPGWRDNHHQHRLDADLPRSHRRRAGSSDAAAGYGGVYHPAHGHRPHGGGRPGVGG